MPTFKPSQPPPVDIGAIYTALSNNGPLTQKQHDQLVAYEQWIRSIGAFDGASKGGLRDVLNALAIFCDGLQDRVTSLVASNSDLQTRVAALEAQPRDPFPGSG